MPDSLALPGDVGGGFQVVLGLKIYSTRLFTNPVHRCMEIIVCNETATCRAGKSIFTL